MASVAAHVSTAGLLFLNFALGAFRATDALVPLQLGIDFGPVLAGARTAHFALGRICSRLQARDLSLSISWGVFASGLLAWGMGRRSPDPQ